MTSVWSSSQFSVWFWPNLCLLGVLGAGQSWAWVQTGRWLAFKVSCHQCFPHPYHQGHNCNIFSTTTNLDHVVNRHASADQDRATLIAQLINKHQEQKEAFLKVIIIIIIILILITIINIIWSWFYRDCSDKVNTNLLIILGVHLGPENSGDVPQILKPESPILHPPQWVHLQRARD